MKKIKIVLLIAVVFVSFYTIFVKAQENNHIQNYVSDNLLWKWYGGNWSTGKLPLIDIDDSLTEGVDYTRSWAFTRNLVGNVSELNYLPYEDALNEEQLPGSVCEKITGLGQYTSEKVVCHIIYGYTYIKADSFDKKENENDPEFTYKVYNYNNLSDDIGSLFNITIEREEGETPGEYELVPKFDLIDNSLISYSMVNNASLKSIQFLFNSLGRIIVQPINGKLTINETEKTEPTIEEISDDYTEVIPIPHTDICLN